MKREKKCMECGGTVRFKAARGRMVPYRNARLEAPADVQIPTCAKCGEMYVDAKTAERLDALMEEEYGTLLGRIATDSLERLSTVTTKRELEVLLGLSQGYLSKVPEKTTSTVLVNLLALLAADPKRSIATLRATWDSSAETRTSFRG